MDQFIHIVALIHKSILKSCRVISNEPFESAREVKIKNTIKVADIINI